MVGRMSYERLTGREERGWNRLADLLGERWSQLDEVDYWAWLDTEAALQEVVEKVVVGKKRHYLAPTVPRIAEQLRKVGHRLHVLQLSLHLERRRILAPPSVLLPILMGNLAPRGPFKKGPNFRFGLASEVRDVARNAAPSP